ncbi:tetratricopeptide repeat protein [Candidatus Sumerlaeota bacterium]|nr:tetratricopeptide repeat protein [Candidatus Sumerlaeota bacterium]
MRKKKQNHKNQHRNGVSFYYYIGLIFALSIIVYANSLKNGFTFDDHDMVEKNQLVRSLSLRNIGEIFSTSWWWGSTRQQSHEYRPLTVLSFAIYYQLAGLRAWFYHLVNIMLNAGVGVLVFLVVRKFASISALALGTGLLFAVHPIHTEAVNNIVGEAELLSALFFMSGLLLFLQGCVRAHDKKRIAKSRAKPLSSDNKPAWILLSLSYGAYLLALLAKEIAITLPVIAVLIHWLMYKERCGEKSGKGDKKILSNFIRGYWVYYIGFVVVVVVYFAMRINALGGVVSPTMTITYLDNVLEKARIEKDYLTLYLTAFKIIGQYLWLLLFPLKLSADYSYDAVPLISSPISAGVILTLLGLAGAFLYVYYHFRRKDWIPLFAVLYFFIVFLPVSNFVKIIGVTMAERLMYLPSVGFCLFGAHVLWKVSGKRRQIFFLFIGGVVLLYSLRTFARNYDWRDDFTLYKATVKTTPRCSRAHFNLANHYKERGDVEKALKHYQRAWQIAPGYGAPLSGIGEILAEQGKLDEAEKVFRQVIQMEDRYYPAHYGLAEVLERLGREHEALREYQKTIKLRPTEPAPYHKSAEILLRQGKLKEAEKLLRQALQIEPRLYISRIKLAEVLGKQKRWKESIKELEIATKYFPQDPRAYFFLGRLYARQGNREKALANLSRAELLAPDNADVHYELGKVYLLLYKDNKRALTHFQRVLEINPDYPQKEKIQALLKKLTQVK